MTVYMIQSYTALGIHIHIELPSYAFNPNGNREGLLICLFCGNWYVLLDKSSEDFVISHLRKKV